MKLEERQELVLPAQCLDLESGADGALLASCYDGSIVRVDAGSGAVETVAKLGNIASGIHWCAPAERLIAADYDGCLSWIDPGSGAVDRRYKAHGFWSWQSARDAGGGRLASVTGQYRAGGYQYEPAPETEPSVRVIDSRSGDTLQAFGHVPPVQSVAFSPDGRHLAAGNLMGEVRIWDLDTGAEEARIATGSFTGWGIIKGHYYTGGVFALHFAPDGGSIFLAGMGSTRDPAAGNGKQLWERWSWRGGETEKLAAARDHEIGQGLMETLAFRPGGGVFAMGGRMFKGDWNLALFDAGSGERIAAANTGIRISKAMWSPDGALLYAAGGANQGKKAEDFEKPWGRIKVFSVG